MSAFAALTRTEGRLFLREPVGVFFTVLFPSLLVGILGAVPSFREPADDLGGLRVIDLYVPIAVALSLAMVALSALPTVLAGYRERGVLRRMSTTPVPPWMLLAAQLVVGLVTAVVALILVTVLARVAFDVPLPGQIAGFVVAFLLAAAALFAIGLFVSALVPNGKAGNAVGTLLFFPLMFFAGLWLPRASMPGALRRVSDITPLGAGVQALQDATHGSWPQPLHLAVLAGYLVIFGAAAATWFRWE